MKTIEEIIKEMFNDPSVRAYLKACLLRDQIIKGEKNTVGGYES